MLIPQALGSYLPDLPDLNNPGVTRAFNCTPGFGVGQGQVTYEPIRRASSYSSEAAMASKPLGTTIGKDKDGNAKIYAGCATALYRIDPATLTWQDISIDGGYSTADGERWVTTEYGDHQFFANYSNFIQFINMNADVQVENATTLVQARALGTVGDFVVAGNVYDNLDGAVPNRVRWSAIGNGLDWNLAQSTQADFQDIYGMGAVQAIVSGSDGYILMRGGIQKMQYRGDSLIFGFYALPSALGKGCMIRQSVVTTEGKTFFVSDDGFYMLQGEQITPVGVGQIDQTFLADIDTSKYATMNVTADPTRKLIYWTYASKDAVNGQPDKQLILNYLTGNWSEAQATVPFTFNSLSAPTTIEQLDKYLTIEGIPASLDSSVWSGGNAFLAGLDDSGEIYVFGGDTLEAQIETAEMHVINMLKQMSPRPINGDNTDINSVRVFNQGDTSSVVKVAIGSREQPFETVVFSPLKTANNSGVASFRWQGRYHRIQINLSGNWDKLSGYEFDASAAGFR